MRIGIDARFLTHPQRGGFKTYTRTVIAALAEADGSSRYVLYTDRPADVSLRLPDNFTVTPVSGPNAVVREQLLLPIAMKRDGIDVAHFPCNTAPIVFGPRMAVTIHDTIPLRDMNCDSRRLNLRQSLLRSYWRAVIPRSARKADLVITDSGHVREDLRTRLDLSADELRVIPLAVDPAFAGDAPGLPPSGMDPRTPFVLAFASADGRKNHLGVIKAYRAASSECPGLRLALVCSHPGVRAGIKCAPGDGVVPLGPLAFDEVLWLYRNALALVFPSFDEGFGLPPLEAMACGTPVIASNTGALPEVAGECAVCVNPLSVESIADGMRLVIRDGVLRESLIRRGRERAARFSCEHMGRELVAAYSDAAKGMMG